MPWSTKSIQSAPSSLNLLPPSSTDRTWKLIDVLSTSRFGSFSLSSSQKAESPLCSSTEDLVSRWLMVSPSSLTHCSPHSQASTGLCLFFLLYQSALLYTTQCTEVLTSLLLWLSSNPPLTCCKGGSACHKAIYYPFRSLNAVLFLDPSILHFPADSFSFFLSSLPAPGKKTDQPTGIKFTQCEVPWKVVRVRPLPVL